MSPSGWAVVRVVCSSHLRLATSDDKSAFLVAVHLPFAFNLPFSSTNFLLAFSARPCPRRTTWLSFPGHRTVSSSPLRFSTLHHTRWRPCDRTIDILPSTCVYLCHSFSHNFHRLFSHSSAECTFSASQLESTSQLLSKPSRTVLESLGVTS